MRTLTISIPSGPTGFAEDKDAARDVRLKKILPALSKKSRVVLDFQGVAIATQSFIHALVGEALKRYGASVLEKIEFKNCSAQLKSVIPLVVEYTLGVVSESDATEVAAQGKARPTTPSA